MKTYLIIFSLLFQQTIVAQFKCGIQYPMEIVGDDGFYLTSFLSLHCNHTFEKDYKTSSGVIRTHIQGTWRVRQDTLFLYDTIIWSPNITTKDSLDTSQHFISISVKTTGGKPVKGVRIFYHFGKDDKAKPFFTDAAGWVIIPENEFYRNMPWEKKLEENPITFRVDYSDRVLCLGTYESRYFMSNKIECIVDENKKYDTVLVVTTIKNIGGTLETISGKRIYKEPRKYFDKN